LCGNAVFIVLTLWWLLFTLLSSTFGVTAMGDFAASVLSIDNITVLALFAWNKWSTFSLLALD